MEVIAKIRTDFPDKFGIPRQSGLVPDLTAEIVFEPKFRNPDAVRGIEEYSHLWLIWEFSKVVEARQKKLDAKKSDANGSSSNDSGSNDFGSNDSNQSSSDFVAMVAPPRLGGKEKKGVFATRSPFRPNPIGLSSVELKDVYLDEKRGPVLVVSGADLLDGTPIYDIKPYLAYTDSHPDAKGSFGEAHKEDAIEVRFPEELLMRLPEDKREAAVAVLKQDPRASYNKKPDYVYGMSFAGYDIRFVVNGFENNCENNFENNFIEVIDVVLIDDTFSHIK